MIAVFGYFHTGNFGDDLMLSMACSELRDHKIPFRVYCSPVAGNELGCDYVDSIPALLEGVRLVVYAGGGAFLRNPGPYNSLIDELCRECAERSIPIGMFSVGGDITPLGQLPPARTKLLRQAAYISFRNPEDKYLIEERSGNCDVFPDIVWRTPLYFPLQPERAGGRLRIGVDLSTRTPDRRWFFRVLGLIASIRGYEITWLDGHALTDGPVPHSVRYESVPAFIAAIVSQDLVVTHRLHIGMTAMAYGGPSLLLKGKPKARIVYKRLGLDRLSVSTRWQMIRVLLQIFRGRLTDLKSGGISKEMLKQLQEESAEHFRKLLTFVK